MNNNYDNRLALAKDVVEDMDMDALFEMAVGYLMAEYELNDAFFQESWFMQYDEEDADGKT